MVEKRSPWLTDPYVKDGAEMERIHEALHRDHAPITLPAIFGYYVEQDMMRFLILLARYKFVVRQLRRSDRVLEIGCGAGLGTQFMGQHCREVVGLESKQYEVDNAQSANRRDNVSFRCLDFFALEEGERFDVIVLLDVIEHMDEAAGRRLVAKALAHLNPAGMLVVGTPSIHSYPYQSPGSQAGHIKLYDQPELVALMEDYFGRCLAFSMNDELVHTGHPKMAWYYFTLALLPGQGKLGDVPAQSFENIA